MVREALGCPITAFAGDSGPFADAAGFETWRRNTSSSFRAKLLPGGHFYLWERAKDLIDEIMADLRPRWRRGLAGELFLGMAESEGLALNKLRGLADWLNLTDDDLGAYEPHPGAQAYPAFVVWLALNGSRADVVLAFVANLAAWGENCGQVALALREAHRDGDDAVAFFEFSAHPPEDFESRAVAVLGKGLAAGDSPVLTRRATRLLQAYELSFRDALAQGL